MLLNRVGRIGGALWGPMPPHFPRTPLCSVLHYIHNWHFQSLLLNFSLFWLFFEKQCQNWHSFTKKVGKTENFLKILETYLILLKVNWTHSENFLECLTLTACTYLFKNVTYLIWKLLSADSSIKNLLGNEIWHFMRENCKLGYLLESEQLTQYFWLFGCEQVKFISYIFFSFHVLLHSFVRLG